MWSPQCSTQYLVLSGGYSVLFFVLLEHCFMVTSVFGMAALVITGYCSAVMKLNRSVQQDENKELHLGIQRHVSH